MSGKRIYACNDDYFEKIDTEDKAYWLGFLYADGCIDKVRGCTILDLSIIDYAHLLLFKESIGSSHKIYFHQDKKGHEYVRLHINSKKMVNDLIDKGCVPAKTFTLKFPKEDHVPKELIPHFIRGYFDGDGCIYAKYKKPKNRPNMFLDTEFNILGTKELLEIMAVYLPIDNITVNKKWGNKIFGIRIYNKISILEIMDYLYKDSSFYLQRKYENFLLIKNYVEKSSCNYKAS